MNRSWTAEDVLEMARGFQPACVLAAAVDLDVFGVLRAGPLTAAATAEAMRTDPRATAVLLDALTAMELLRKQAGRYSVPPEVADLLTDAGAHSVVNMARHQANCLRRWVQLPQVVQSGRPAERKPSIRGEAADEAAFIGAMHNVSGPLVETVMEALQPLRFDRLLDIGGASGTWTMAFLRAAPQAKATLFDLPDVIPMARRRLTEAGLADRVTLVPGDFYRDPLPGGCDLAWISAIVHQNSREQNRELFAKVQAALTPGGTVLIRDIVMDASHVHPAAGAMFAINMLVSTPLGGTYTFEELRDDLAASGFAEATLLRRGEGMDSIVRATKR
jgi:predicted O-methyltransferase YrrM